MDINWNSMDYRKIIDITEIQPVVNMANYFELKDDTCWGPRKLIDFELILIRRESFDFRQPGQPPLKVNPGEVLIIPPGVEHTFAATVRSGAIACIHCLPAANFPWESGLVEMTPAPSTVTRFPDDSDMDRLFRKCSDLFTGYENYREELLSTICREIWLRCASKWETPGRVRSSRMDKMIGFIRENCRRPLTRKDIAESFNLSPEYVNALFQKELGISPTDCINREKVFLAYQYLNRDGLSVKETAYACGFNDPFYFSRVFKKILGITPDTVRSRKFFAP